MTLYKQKHTSISAQLCSHSPTYNCSYRDPFFALLYLPLDFHALSTKRKKMHLDFNTKKTL